MSTGKHSVNSKGFDACMSYAPINISLEERKPFSTFLPCFFPRRIETRYQQFVGTGPSTGSEAVKNFFLMSFVLLSLDKLPLTCLTVYHTIPTFNNSEKEDF